MINVLQVIYSNAIRYELLANMTKLAFNGYDDINLNIYIDLYPIFRTLLKPDYLDLNSDVDLCSGVLNLAAHYRRFFERYCDTKTNIFIINSMNTPMRNAKTFEGYNKEFMHRYNTRTTKMNEIINLNLSLLETLVPYIPDVYMISSTYESSVVMYDIINKHSNGYPNLIISRDIYPRQLPAILDKTILYRPKLDKSYYVDSKNVFNSILFEHGVKCSKYNFSGINPKLFSLFYTLNGMKCRNIKSQYVVSTAKKHVEKAIENKIILNDYNSIIDWSSIQSKRDPELLDSIFQVIDIPLQHSIYVNDIESKYNLQNLYDPESVKAINNTYFTHNNQINLNDF